MSKKENVLLNQHIEQNNPTHDVLFSHFIEANMLMPQSDTIIELYLLKAITEQISTNISITYTDIFHELGPETLKQVVDRRY